MSKFGWFAIAVFTCALLNQRLQAHSYPQNAQSTEHTLSLQLGQLTELLIDAGAGDLQVIGNDSQQINVEAKIFGHDIRPQDYRLSLDEQNGKAVIYAHITSDFDDNARIDLVVSVPASMKLEVRDRSGDIEIQAISGGLTITDRSGAIKLSNIKGATTIDDSSGDILIDGLRGPLKIDDRSGDIVLKRIEGDGRIVDRSGDILVKHLSGNLTIEDSSGDVNVKAVSGVVSVDDSSGSIDIDGAEEFILLNDSSGDVSLANITQQPIAKALMK